MKYELRLAITSERDGCRVLRSSVELPIPPTTDSEFSYPIWSNAKKPDSITFHLDHGDTGPTLQAVTLTFTERLSNGMTMDQHVQLFLDEGWKEL